MARQMAEEGIRKLKREKGLQWRRGMIPHQQHSLYRSRNAYSTKEEDSHITSEECCQCGEPELKPTRIQSNDVAWRKQAFGFSVVVELRHFNP
ncbi:hypothetical protein NDU88_006789 [Pleurodeles waltl]|uniref:Uncharacterized protein n=1 Tax=Pleurodeles waltl TaxID=8319 RepID=A0AAV7RN86_PLEWA|nr:hypothetical protein NDU88_006789 [Pleurodeles waltl]